MTRPPDDRPPGPGPVPGEGLFRLLMRLHPPSFRDRYAGEMLGVFREGWHEEASGKGPGAAVGFWLRTLRGTVRTAMEQRLGTSDAEASAAARGPPEQGVSPAGQVRRETTTGGGGMTGWLNDLRLVIRRLRRRPAFALLVVATIALGLGANSAVFSVLHGVILSPLPYDDDGRLVRMYSVEEVEPDDLEHVPGMAFIELREQVGSLEVTALYNYQEEFGELSDGERPERVRFLRVGSGYFRLLGAAPLVGRTFRRDEERDSTFVAVVRQGVWERYLDADPDVVGRASVLLEGVGHTVVGVMPETFEDPLDEEVDVWIPQDLQPGGSNNFDNQYLTVLGRLEAGTSLEAAQEEVTGVSRRLAERFPGAEGRRGRLVSLHEDVVGDASTTLYVITGASGFLLLIACVNVAGLFLVRGASARRELAIRAALGSGRGRLVRQVLAESVVLSVAGGVAGLLLGGALLEVLLSVAPADLPRLAELSVDGPVVLYGMGLAVAVGILFGLGPALRYSRTEVGGTLAVGDGKGGSEHDRGPAGRRLRGALVVVEVGLALVLLVGAGILLRSVQELGAVDMGFRSEGVQTFQVHLPEGRYADPAERALFHRALHERLEAVPGVRRSGAVSNLPATGEWFSWGTGLSDASGDRDTDTFIGANQRTVEGDYFEALEIPLLRGRVFGPQDDAEAVHAVVVNETLVRRLWPERELEGVLGEELWYGPWQARVIGVVGDAAVGPRVAPVPKVYHSHTQHADNRNWQMRHVVRLEASVPDLGAVIRREVAALDPFLVVDEVRPLAEIVGRGVARERFASLLLALFSAVAALLAAVGIYGILAYSVSRRRREIGVRVALGARAAAVRRMVVGEGLRLASAGVILGVPAALALTRWLESLVFRVSTTDPWIFSGVTAGVLGIALLASWIPALRATRLDPTEALRAD